MECNNDKNREAKRKSKEKEIEHVDTQREECRRETNLVRYTEEDTGKEKEADTEERDGEKKKLIVTN